jgi:tetrahydromethanopterin S-methyltransferase subunit G
MKRKLWVLFLGFALCFVPLSRVAAQSPADQPSKLDQEIAKIKAAISKRVADDKDKVKLKLRDGSEVKGRLDQAGGDSFTLTNDKSGQPMTFAYADVQQVNGRGLGRGAKIGIISAIVVGVFAIVVIKAVRNFDPFENGIRIQGVNF